MSGAIREEIDKKIRESRLKTVPWPWCPDRDTYEEVLRESVLLRHGIMQSLKDGVREALGGKTA